MSVETGRKTGAGRLSGVLAPVLTPFGKDLAPDAPRFVRQCRWLLSQGRVGLAVFGTNWEANSLSTDEKASSCWTRLVAGRDRSGRAHAGDRLLRAHRTRCGSPRTRWEAGARVGCSSCPPSTTRASPTTGSSKSFAEVIERVGDRRLRLYVYRIPPVVAGARSPSGLIERLLQGLSGRGGRR